MASVLSVCPRSGCGRLGSGGLCAECRQEDNRRRHAKNRARGWTDTAVRRAVRKAVLERDGYRCQECGSTEDLTVHHNPRDRRQMTTLCRSCHGSIDAPRARLDAIGVKGGAVGKISEPMTPGAPRVSTARVSRGTTVLGQP